MLKSIKFKKGELDKKSIKLEMNIYGTVFYWAYV
jgi:hypothetical protein